MFTPIFKRGYALPALATAFALFFLLSVMFNPLFNPTSQTPPSATLNTETAASNPTDAPDFTQISVWHLFGQSENTGDGMARGRPLDLKLRGVFYLGSKNQARAIIESANQMQKTYRVNTQLPGGEILQTIDHDKVTLLINDQEIILPLGKYESPQEAVETPPAE